jgi:YVTN family beta-propeller protein
MFKKFLPIILLALSVATLHARTTAYVTNSSSNTVSVIDVPTNTVTATIAVGNMPFGVGPLPGWHAGLCGQPRGWNHLGH